MLSQISTDKHDPHEQIEKSNNWYVANQFEQLRKSGTRVVIEQRWKCFADALIHYLKRRVLFDVNKPLRCLDAGCGDGVNLQWAAGFFQKHYSNVKFTALDYNHLRVNRVVKNRLAKETLVGSLLEIPFNDSIFDIVFCNHVLEHIEQYQKALVEIMRVLKPGGLLLLGVPNEGCFLGRLRNRIIQRSILKKTDHVNFFRSKIINEALRSAGFSVVRVYREGFFVPHSWAYYVFSCFALGRLMLFMLGRIFPSQSACLIVYAIKPGDVYAVA